MDTRMHCAILPAMDLRFRSVANRKVLKSGAVANCKPMCALWLESFAARNKLKEKRRMLYTIALVLIIAWLLGIVSSYTLGGFIYILLVVAIIMILVRLIQGRKL